MFLFDVGIGCGVGEIAFSAFAGEISALWITFGSPGWFLTLHKYEYNSL